jgi:hypothetical protein
MCGATDDICFTDDDCPAQLDVCTLFPNCHEEDLCPDFDDDGMINGSDFCFEPPGPTSSPKKCNAARKNGIFVP